MPQLRLFRHGGWVGGTGSRLSRPFHRSVPHGEFPASDRRHKILSFVASLVPGHEIGRRSASGLFLVIHVRERVAAPILHDEARVVMVFDVRGGGKLRGARLIASLFFRHTS